VTGRRVTIRLTQGDHPPTPRRRPGVRPKQPVPPCFTVEQFHDWIQYARAARPGAAGYCADCLPGYQERMLREGRCLHPEIRFVIKHGGWIGQRPDEKEVDTED